MQFADFNHNVEGRPYFFSSILVELAKKVSQKTAERSNCLFIEAPLLFFFEEFLTFFLEGGGKENLFIDFIGFENIFYAFTPQFLHDD